MKPRLKPPGTKRLILKCDGPLSSFGVKFDLGPYTLAQELWVDDELLEEDGGGARQILLALSRPSNSFLQPSPLACRVQ
jgi:hypothetical protein